jgi:hypothetical protein
VTISEAELQYIPRHRRPGAAAAVTVVAVGVVAAGEALGAQREVLVLFMAIAAVAWLVLVRTQVVLGLAMWIAATVNVVPGIDFNQRLVPGPLTSQDLLIVLLAAAGLLAAGRLRAGGPSVVPRWLLVLSFFTLAWWVLTVLRTWSLEGAPLVAAAAFGRDLVFVAVVAPLTCLLLCDADFDDIVVLSAIITGLGAWYAAIYSVFAATGVDISLLIHPLMSTNYYALPRAYAAADALVPLGLILSFWFALGTRGRGRPYWVAALIVLAAGELLQFTRMAYVGVVLAIVVGLVMAVARPEFRAVRRQAVAVVSVVAIGVMLWTAVLTVPDMVSQTSVAGNPVYERIASMTAELGVGSSGTSGTVKARQTGASNMLEALGHSWVWGVGFLSPEVRYFSGLELGSIRNADLGIFNALMTMGAIGVALLLLAPLLAAFYVGRSRLPGNAEAMLALGLVGYYVFLLITSVSLVVLFSTWTTPLAGVVIGIGIVFGLQARRLGQESLDDETDIEEDDEA